MHEIGNLDEEDAVLIFTSNKAGEFRARKLVNCIAWQQACICI